MKIKRTINNNEVEIQLTNDELLKSYAESHWLYTRDWIESLLDEYDYPKMSKEELEKITDKYLHYMEDGDLLGELEHRMFERTMEYFENVGE